MFDLEKSIRDWKIYLQKQPTFEDGTIADFENHLRDAIDELKSKGIPEKEAFREAVARVGGAEILAAECVKVREYKLDLRRPWRPTRFMPALLGNYLKASLRKIRRERGYSFLNIAGMTIGIVCCFLIGLYIQSQLSFDKFNVNFDRIYRITYYQATTAPALARAMRDNFPEIENYVQMYDPGEVLIKRSKDNMYFKIRTLYASAKLFDVFTVPMTQGDPGTALDKPYTAVIDQETARIHFGSEDPLGQILNISTRFGVGDYQITGIMRDVPRNSHFKPHILISLETFNTFGNDLKSWGSNFIHSYVLLKKNADARAVQKQIPELIAKYAGKAREGYILQPLADVHLKSSAMAFSIEPGSDINFLYIMSFAAFLILLIACANYANLVTAMSLKRFREIGVRKVFGAEKSQLIGQFLLESASVILTAVVLSALTAVLLIKPAAALLGMESGFLLTDLPRTLFLLLVIGVISAALAGAYPAVYLSGIRPADVFRRVEAEKPGRSLFRNGLVVVQFAIAIFLIIGAVVVGKQVRFIRNKELGFNREQILIVSIGQKDIQNRADILKAEMLKIPGIQGLTFSSTLPMNLDWRNGFDYEGRTDEAREVSSCCCYVDPDYCDVFGLKLIAGQGFSRDNPSDAKYERAFIINETAAKMLRWENPIGKRMAFEGKAGRVVGVIKDFNNLPLSLRIEPVTLIQSERNRRLLSINVRPENMEKTIAAVKKVWDEFANGWPFEYRFMDEAYNAMYKAVIIVSRQSRVFSAVALFLTCFGLFGLVSFITGRRTKEIGIRKVLGASAPKICKLLSRGFTIPILLANCVAWPVAYLFLKDWLQKFAYHVDFGIGVFLGAGVLTWLIAMITVMGRSYRAAAANPVESIRYE